MTKSGCQLFTSAATRPSSGVSAPKSPITTKRTTPGAFSGTTGVDASAGGVASAAELGFGPASAGSTRLHPTQTTSHRSGRHARPPTNSPLFGEKIAQGAELGSLGDAGAVLLVSRFLGIFLERPQR